ncbi:MAG: H-type lectin domain-containing protein [Melioribacteraceae bacterium]|nr:H-type lectin domain-containing protein [Melioribacteraceae bacterium]MCF8353489.1 H-type lectin domain-containing protein [Melioribacteraceae bacterium]MCF8392618.1 H-type lectin domain-containing protein [Melioribacteraceae bacterium]MCF8418510.1 H-type lectin domain-containing protein [Melioribacteraceae bacterium]
MKKILMTLLFLAALGVAANAQQILSGSYKADYNSAGYSLHQNSGARTFTIDVVFEKKFDSRPEIVLTVNELDAEAQNNVRYRVEAKAVSSEGFLLTITTWGDSKVYGVGGNWLAHSK